MADHDRTAQAGAGLVDRIDYPLFVVTAHLDGEDSGCLIGFATQCSIQPFRYLACVSTANHTYRLATRTPALAVHLLGEGQRPLAELFGGTTGDMVDKFSQCSWRRGPAGSPVLDDCAAWIEGEVLDRVSLGDHLGLVLEPIDGARGSASGQLTLSMTEGLAPGHPA